MKYIDAEIKQAGHLKRPKWVKHANLAQQTEVVEPEIEALLQKVEYLQERKSKLRSEAAASLGEAQVTAAVAENNGDQSLESRREL